MIALGASSAALGVHLVFAAHARTLDGAIHRYDYAGAWRRTEQLASALDVFGLAPGDRVGTLAWSGPRHLEIYYAVSGRGMCAIPSTRGCSPIKSPTSSTMRATGCCSLIHALSICSKAFADRLAHVNAIVVMTDAADMPTSSKLPTLACYEELIAAAPEGYQWPELDENTAAGMCYTSGTTGEPKGVLYSHRSTVLRAMTVCLPDVFGVDARWVVLPIVPMFHVNAWGLPYAAPLVGAKLVLCGAKLDGASLHELITSEGATFSASVPTVWMTLLDWAAANQTSLAGLERVVIGGAALPPVLIERLRSHGIEARHAWGMTETSPAGLAALSV